MTKWNDSNINNIIVMCNVCSNENNNINNVNINENISNVMIMKWY